MLLATELVGSQPARIMVINVSRIGDTLLATPALRALAAELPAASITCLGHPKRVELLRNLPFLDHVSPITKHLAILKGWLGGRPYDLAIVYGFDKALVRYALRVSKRVVAYRQGDAALDARLMPAVTYPDIHKLHAVDLHLTLTDSLGVPVAGKTLAYEVTPEEREEARRHLTSLVGPHAGPLIGLVVESFQTKPYRDWPVGHFADLVRALAERYARARFLLFGGKVDALKISSLKEAAAGRLVTLAGTLSLRQSAARMAELDLYIGVDTGPTHLAGALKIPMVSLYHCLHPAWQLAPLEHPLLAAIQQAPPPSGDAREHSMASISVEQVELAALALLSRGAHGDRYK